MSQPHESSSAVFTSAAVEAWLRREADRHRRERDGYRADAADGEEDAEEFARTAHHCWATVDNLIDQLKGIEGDAATGPDRRVSLHDVVKAIRDPGRHVVGRDAALDMGDFIEREFTESR